MILQKYGLEFSDSENENLQRILKQAGVGGYGYNSASSLSGMLSMLMVTFAVQFIL